MALQILEDTESEWQHAPALPYLHVAFPVSLKSK